jgi:hypothetical protein
MRRQRWTVVIARLIHCVAFNPSQFINLVHLFTHPVLRCAVFSSNAQLDSIAVLS